MRDLYGLGPRTHGQENLLIWQNPWKCRIDEYCLSHYLDWVTYETAPGNRL